MTEKKKPKHPPPATQFIDTPRLLLASKVNELFLNLDLLAAPIIF